MKQFLLNLSPIEKLIIAVGVVMLGVLFTGSVMRESENQKLLSLCLQERPAQEYQCHADAEARRIQQERNTAIILNGSNNR